MSDVNMIYELISIFPDSTYKKDELIKKMERDSLLHQVTTGQGRMVLNEKRGNLD